VNAVRDLQQKQEKLNQRQQTALLCLQLPASAFTLREGKISDIAKNYAFD
jgi:hypothetical protein